VSIEEAMQIMGRQIERAQLQLALAIEPEMPRVRADARALRQILLNLLSNAVKFTPEAARSRSGSRACRARVSHSRSPTPASASRPTTSRS